MIKIIKILLLNHWRVFQYKQEKEILYAEKLLEEKNR